MDTIKINKGNAKIIAHRGLSGIEVENTNSAFVAAGNRSYFGIETDVRNTADGNFVLLHDDTTERCGIDVLSPEKCSLQTILSVQLKDKDGVRGRYDLRVPEMIDYIRICKRYGKVSVLEFKGLYNDEQMVKLVEQIKTVTELENIIFISFAFDNLVTLRRHYPEAHCQFLTGEYKQEILDLLVEHGMGLDIWSRALDCEEKVKHILEMGIELNVWTVDDPAEAEKLISWGAQYITSNILE